MSSFKRVCCGHFISSKLMKFFDSSNGAFNILATFCKNWAVTFNLLVTLTWTNSNKWEWMLQLWKQTKCSIFLLSLSKNYLITCCCQKHMIITFSLLCSAQLHTPCCATWLKFNFTSINCRIKMLLCCVYFCMLPQNV